MPEDDNQQGITSNANWYLLSVFVIMYSIMCTVPCPSNEHQLARPVQEITHQDNVKEGSVSS